ncbi:MAG: discoidin domain-containing protein, partial [Candidatus Zipacnadales bacterium]
MGEKMQGTYANRDLPACNWLAQWAEENPEVVAGTRSVVEIVVAEATEDFVDSGLLWGTELPQELQPRPVQVVSMAAQAGYLVSHPGSTGSWRDALLGCRALILPDQAVLASTDADIIRRFVRQGGVVIAFSHATLLEPASPDLGGSPPAEAITNKPPLLREDYALADVLGAHYAGLISARDSLHVVVTADSIWAPQYSPPNVIDGDPATFWASIEGGPMPHWIEIALSKPATVSGARVACRPGFLLKDFEVHYKTDEAWEIGATVVDNTEWTIECLFLEPVRISAARLFVKREELNGENRVIADVSEFILLNEKGRPLIVPPYHLEV